MRKTIIAVVSTFLAVSCALLDLKPEVIERGTFYQGPKQLEQGLYGCYGVLNSTELYGMYWSLSMTGLDDLCYYNRNNITDYCELFIHDASTAKICDSWAKLYEGVKNCNAFLEAVSESGLDRQEDFQTEVRFLRAYYYFLLAQGWGDVPLRLTSSTSPLSVKCPATKQEEIFEWVAAEMEACVENAKDNPAFAVSVQPSRVSLSTMRGILSRVYLFMAGATTDFPQESKREFHHKVLSHTDAVIGSGEHALDPDYTQVFIRMISDKYDTRFRESMWEVEFLGNRETSDFWSNGRIGDLNGMMSQAGSGFSSFNCNYSYGMYSGSLKLWDLYWHEDRVDSERDLPIVTDIRQEWNMAPYNYAGSDYYPPYGDFGSDGSGARGSGSSKASIDKTPYAYRYISTTVDPTSARGDRNSSKFRREAVYEGHQNAKNLFTSINFPLLRYSDILLMRAEADNEYYKKPSYESYLMLKEVRSRAGIQTKPFDDYSDYASFKSFVMNERGRELCFESVRRWDLIRWGVFVESMNAYAQWTSLPEWESSSLASRAANMGSNVQEKHILFPIPTIELGVNTEMKQNRLW